MSRALREALRPIAGRLSAMVSRAVLTGADDAPGVQEVAVDLLDDENQDGVERFQTYGLTSVPPAGLEALVAFPGGVRSHGVVIAVGDRVYRLKGLQTGEVALYDDQGQTVRLTRTGVVVSSDLPVRLESATRVEIAAPQVLLDSADVRLGGAGGKKLALDGDPVVAGKVVASAERAWGR